MHKHLNNRVALDEITDIASFDQTGKTMLVWDFIKLMELLFKNKIKIINSDKLESTLENNTYYTFPSNDSSPLILKARINYKLYYFQSIKGLFKASPKDMENKYKKYSLEDYVEILDKEGISISIASAFFQPFLEKYPKFLNIGYDKEIQGYEKELKEQVSAGGYLYCPKKSDTINAFISSAAELKEYYFYDDYCYDVNSLYPYLASYFKIPYGEPLVCKLNVRQPNHVYFYKVDIDAKPKDEDCLPLMLSEAHQKDPNIDKYVSGIHENIWLIDKELDYLKAHYEVKNIKYHVILEFKTAPNNKIKDYLEPELQRKEKLPDGILRWISKQKVNTFVGRLGYKFGEHNCFMHRYIIGLGRSILCEIGTIIKRKGYNVYYCDTDSIHTNMPVEEFSKVFDFDNIKIGCFKLENHFRVARYYAIKNYVGEDYDSGKIIVKAAGIEKESEDRTIIQKEFKKGLKFIGG